jgi:hypothetical protein
MLIADHIAILRGLIKQHSEVETPYTDQYLYKIFTTAAARLIRQREERNHKQSDWNTPLYSIALVADSIHGYGCLPGCTILRTTYKIPKPVTARHKDLLKVYTLDMQEIPYINPADNKTLQYDEIRRGKLHYSIVNDYVYIWNGDPTNIVPRVILVNGYFTDPSDWANITACDAEGNETTTCFDIFTSDYPLDEDLAYPAYQLVLELLKIPLQLPDDRQNQQASQ